ncbi:MAG: undecaprenyldiphospho-muramoylpentapeptide beta-N-acetylglucosaminyltransferase [Eggerthellales bacterium]|nr:undecaprenyldiphospho-muramoylpentapeptide beta-N-acetylglucosaminyltransferase [Eggerthellales bacterium]
MLFVLSGGGTAGHINPALALAEELTSRGHEVQFAGTPGGIESRLVPQAGIPFTAFEAAGFDRSHPLTLPKGVYKIMRSLGKAKKWLRDIGADGVVCFGGYVCIPVGMAAESLGIPVVVHEQNSVMGMANKQLSKKAASVALTYQVAGESVADKGKLVLTGNPVRKSFASATRAEGREFLGIPADARMLLVFGGSLGARHINTAVCALKDELLSHPDLYVVHVTGKKEYEAVCQQLALTPEEERRWKVMDYNDQMALTMAAADAVVSRAGATSLAEISLRAVPALLVPFPFATADHQTVNAKEYVEAGAAYMVADDAVETDAFTEPLLRLVDDEAVRAQMHERALALETVNAAAKLADVVIAAAQGK